MPTPRHLREVRDGELLLLVGTSKGAFLIRPSTREVAGPYLAGEEISTMTLDARGGRRRLWAAAGATLRFSDDWGRSWSEPIELGDAKRVWQIALAGSSTPDRLWAGVEPAGLFESRDGGASWSAVRGVHGPGALHGILPDPSVPERVVVALAPGGLLRTEDGGATWQAANRDLDLTSAGGAGPYVHRAQRVASRPERIFLQTHRGVFRSDDDGATWSDVSAGLSSPFGFALATHPRDAHTAWVVPLESHEFRCVPDGRLRVWRTRNGGMRWQPMSAGLPQEHAWETVLREGLAADSRDPVGLWLGTRSGRIFVSRDEGKSWHELLRGLPPILCVRPAGTGRVIGGEKQTRKTIVKSRRRKKKAQHRKPAAKKRELRRPRWRPKRVRRVKRVKKRRPARKK